MTDHARREKRLRNDIGAKNQLRKRIEQRTGQVRQWEEKLASSRSLRWRKRYASTIAVVEQEIEQLKSVLAVENAGLQQRISAEMNDVAAQVGAFTEQFTRARADAVRRRSEYEKPLAAARSREEMLSDATAEESAEVHVRLSKVIDRVRRLQSQGAEARRGAGEAHSESDGPILVRQLFEAELQRIVAENSHFGLNAGS